ncbi:hypothetical protein ES707_21662 [subsurface metagenome]
MMIRWLTVPLAREAIEVLPADLEAIKKERFDVAVVDGLMEEAETACCRIRELRDIPVLLMLSQRQADWGKLQSLDPDGYILYGTVQAELGARLRAVVRRCSRSNRRY